MKQLLINVHFKYRHRNILGLSLETELKKTCLAGQIIKMSLFTISCQMSRAQAAQ